MGSDRALDELVAEFAALRPRLFGIAYRMLGSVADAEDIVQDAWVRWQGQDRAEVGDATAFLVTVTTRLAINATQRARVRRESYVGPWLPEPVDTSADPALGAERGDVLQTEALVVLESLTPTERAAFVLREAFDYPYERIGEVLRTTAANARQLVSRARRHIAQRRHRPAGMTGQRQLLAAFLAAARTGELAQLEALFASEVASYTDGGGAVRNASRIPVVGRTRVARYLRAFAGRFWAGVVVDWVEANGGPAALVSRDGEPEALLVVHGRDQVVDRIYWVMNPAKLTHIAAAPRTSGPS